MSPYLIVEQWTGGVKGTKDNCLVYDGAKYVAETETCKELIWLNDFMEELDKEQVSSPLHSDNQCAINLVKKPVYHDRSKYIDVWYHFIRTLLKDDVMKIHTSRNPTGMLTKVVTDGEAKHLLNFRGSSRVKIWIWVATNAIMS